MYNRFANIVIVETPLQLMCGYEADSDALFVLRLTGRGNNDEQVLNVASLLSVNYIKISISVETPILDFIKNLKVVIKLSATKFKCIYFGSYFSRINKLFSYFLRYKSSVYLDDGVATLILKGRVGKKINIFTFLDVSESDNLKVTKHKFIKVKEAFAVKNILGEYFIGQPFVDKDMMGFDEYLSYVERAAEKCGSQLFYVPHRVESEEFVAAISKVKGVEVLRVDVCIELYFLVKSIMPKRIYSCSSTALITLSILSPKTAGFAYIGKDPRITGLPHINEIISNFKAIDSIVVVDNEL